MDAVARRQLALTPSFRRPALTPSFQLGVGHAGSIRTASAVLWSLPTYYFGKPLKRLEAVCASGHPTEVGTNETSSTSDAQLLT